MLRPILAVLLLAGPAVAAGDAALATAKAAHAKELAKLRDQLLADIDKVIKQTDDAGGTTEYMLRERRGFAEVGATPILPKLKPLSDKYHDAKETADKALEEAYAKAIETSTAAGKVADVTVLKAELKKLQDARQGVVEKPAISNVPRPKDGSSPKGADPVREKLEKAIGAYDAERATYIEKVEVWFKGKETAARNAGSKKILDQIKDERAAFQRSDDLPATAPADLKRRVADARGRLTRAYEEATKSYVRAMKDKEAAGIEKDLAYFKNGVDPSDSRRRWVHSRGEFKIIRRGQWEELTPDNARLRWDETGRTKEYVEVSAVFNATRHFIRLMDGTDGRKSETEVEWKRAFLGKWAEN